jgi:hypothetical protein
VLKVPLAADPFEGKAAIARYRSYATSTGSASSGADAHLFNVNHRSLHAR